jgi:hypothetical protein
MKKTSISITLAAVLVSSAGFAGASPSDHINKAQKSNVQASKKPQSKGWITAPSKKGGSGVVVRYRIDGTPAVGKALPITLSLSGVSSESGASVALTTEDTNLKMDKVRSAPQKLASYQATAMPMAVTPQAEGTFYITVTTEQEGRGSVTMIPIRVGHGKVAMKPMGELVTTPEGEKIISMPAK